VHGGVERDLWLDYLSTAQIGAGNLQRAKRWRSYELHEIKKYSLFLK